MWVTVKRWFLRITSVYFLVTAVTGLLLYFRPIGDERAGLYSAAVSKVIVGLHNGEIFSWVLVDNRYWSGIAVGVVLTCVLVWHSVQTLKR